MDCLYGQDGLSQNELATESFKNAPTVSRIIDLLCKKGITDRQRFDNDRRRYKIFLTKEGEKIYKKTHPHVEELRKLGWAKLNNKDYAEFVRIMDKIYKNYSP